MIRHDGRRTLACPYLAIIGFSQLCWCGIRFHLQDILVEASAFAKGVGNNGSSRHGDGPNKSEIRSCVRGGNKYSNPRRRRAKKMTRADKRQGALPTTLVVTKRSALLMTRLMTRSSVNDDRGIKAAKGDEMGRAPHPAHTAVAHQTPFR